MGNLFQLCKEFTSPSTATSGIAGYDLEGEVPARQQKYRVKLARLKARRAGLGKILKGTPVDTAAHEAATSPWNLVPQPTEDQKHAGNYRKGHISISGISIAIENPAGSSRAPEWPPLRSHYGYIKRTEGADGDHVDVFVKPGTQDDFSGPFFIIDQFIDGKFDEHKCMVGWSDEASACQGYLDNYEEGWSGLKSIHQFDLQSFKEWLYQGDTTVPLMRFLKSAQCFTN